MINPPNYCDLPEEKQTALKMARAMGHTIQFYSMFHSKWKDRENHEEYFHGWASYRIKPHE